MTLGGEVVIDIEALKPLCKYNDNRLPPVDAIMRCVKGYSVKNVSYPQHILGYQVDPSMQEEAGDLFGRFANPAFPLDISRQAFNYEEDEFNRLQAYIKTIAFQAWTISKNRWLIRDKYSDSEPNYLLVVQAADFKINEKHLQTDVHPSTWLSQDWSFGTYFCRVLRSIFNNKDKPNMRRDGIHNLLFVPHRIQNHSTLIHSLFPHLPASSSFKTEKEYNRNKAIYYEMSSDATADEPYCLPLFYSHAWFSCDRPILDISMIDMERVRNVAYDMYSFIARASLSEHKAHESYVAGSCPAPLIEQHRLNRPYLVCGGEKKGRLYHVRPTYADRLHTEFEYAFFNPVNGVDIPALFHSFQKASPTLVTDRSAVVPVDKMLREDISAAHITCGIDLSEPLELGEMYLRLVHSKSMPMSRILRLLYHCEWVQEMKACVEGRHHRCVAPYVNSLCPLARLAPFGARLFCDPNNYEKPPPPGGYTSPTEISHKEYNETPPIRRGVCIPDAVAASLVTLSKRSPIDYTRAYSSLDEFTIFLKNLKRSISVTTKQKPIIGIMKNLPKFSSMRLLASEEYERDPTARYLEVLDARVKLWRKLLFEPEIIAAIFTELSVQVVEGDIFRATDNPPPIRLKVPERLIATSGSWILTDANQTTVDYNASASIIRWVFERHVIQPLVDMWCVHVLPPPGPFLEGSNGALWVKEPNGSHSASTEPSSSSAETTSGKGKKRRRCKAESKQAPSIEDMLRDVESTFTAVTRGSNKASDVNKASAEASRLISKWIGMPEARSSLSHAVFSIDENTDLRQTLLLALMTLSLQQRVKNDEDTNGSRQLEVIHHFRDHFSSLRRLWETDMLKGAEPPRLIKEEPQSLIDTNHWTVEESEEVVHYLYHILCKGTPDLQQLQCAKQLKICTGYTPQLAVEFVQRAVADIDQFVLCAANPHNYAFFRQADRVQLKIWISTFLVRYCGIELTTPTASPFERVYEIRYSGKEEELFAFEVCHHVVHVRADKMAYRVLEDKAPKCTYTSAGGVSPAALSCSSLNSCTDLALAPPWSTDIDFLKRCALNRSFSAPLPQDEDMIKTPQSESTEAQHVAVEDILSLL